MHGAQKCRPYEYQTEETCVIEKSESNKTLVTGVSQNGRKLVTDASLTRFTVEGLEVHLRRIATTCVLLVMLGRGLLAQTPTGTAQDSSSRARPDAAPTPPDAPTPDLGQQTSTPPKSKAKKVVNKYDPHCIDVIFHACWSSPAAPQGKLLTEDEKKAKQVAEDIEVGYYYLNQKNYVAAESRLREAVELKPDAAAAWVGLGQAQQKLHRDDAARQSYEEYLKLNPDSTGAEQAKKAIASLQPPAR